MQSTLMKRLRASLSIGYITARSLPLVWSAAPVDVSLLGGLLLIQGIVPALSVWLSKLALDSVIKSVNVGKEALPIVLIVLLWGVALLLESALSPWILALTGNLNEKLTAHITLLLMQKASSLPDLATFENATLYNNLQILEKQASSRPVNLVVILVTASRQFISLLSMLILLATLGWWIPLLILTVALPQTKITIDLQAIAWRALINQSYETRRMKYFSTLTMTDLYAKEIRLFDFGSYLIEQFNQVFQKFYHTMQRLRMRQAAQVLPMILIGIAGNTFVFWWTVSHAVNGYLTPGDVILFVQALLQTQSYLQGFIENIGFLQEKILFFEKLLQFLAFESPMQLKTSTLEVSKAPQLITFQNVTFAYSDGYVALKNVNLSIKLGEKIAIVGENGAGKTTLVKLLARFYDPTEGKILIDGVDLRALDLKQWRTQIGAIFQDYGKYDLTVRENIALGHIANLNQTQAIKLAAEQASFAEVVEQLPQQYDTLLGKQFDGDELSGGQWQKLAIARAFFSEKPLLILDEPTAALDPRSERDVFKHFAALSAAKTALLITHRLGSLQMADRIIVLKNGQLIEQGSHEELVACNGEYASLYKTQADLYTMKEV